MNISALQSALEANKVTINTIENLAKNLKVKTAILYDICDPDDPSTLDNFNLLNNYRSLLRNYKNELKQLAVTNRVIKAALRRS